MHATFRILLTTLALGAAAASVLYQSAREAELADVERAFAEVAPTADAARRLQTVMLEVEPVRARVVASRELIAGVVRGLPPESSDQRELLVDAAEQAREFATAALRDRPADADAAALLGASTYLMRSLDRDRRLFTESVQWEAPLERAIELAPGSNRASEFLAMAYLDVWSALSERKREIAIDLLRNAFSEAETFRRLIPAWLRLAPDLETALSVVPDDPFAWQDLSRVLAREQRIAELVVVEQIRREKLVEDIEIRLSEAARRLAAARPREARLLHLGVLKEAGVDGLFAPQVGRVLGTLPPGPVDAATASRLRSWLDWTLELCLLEPCPFPPEVIRRLDVLSGNESNALRAAAALAADDLVEGERLLRLQGASTTTRGVEWAPYRLLAARRYRERGDFDAAARQLDAVHRDWREHPVAEREARRLIEAQRGPPRRPVAAAPPRTQRWESWRWTRADQRSKMIVEALSTGGLHLEVLPEQGPSAVLSLAIDGGAPRLVGAEPGRRLESGAVLTPGLHLLEVTRVAGGEVRPADVIVEP
ncbi:MAG TPA: hypothetical protein VMT85_01215 [Thermoanaerobaculia bacterium]|nr:hypothetical protein [Thermoanaerobaculia bacterium]